MHVVSPFAFFSLSFSKNEDINISDKLSLSDFKFIKALDNQVYTMIQYVYMSKNKLTSNQLKAIRHIRNCLMHYSRSPSVREIMDVLGYRSPRSAALVLNNLIERGIIKRDESGALRLLKDPEESKSHGRTVNLPLVGMVPCGSPLLAEENIEAMVPVSKSLVHSNHIYFLLRAYGDSMDEVGIKDGDLLLIRQQAIAEEGEKVVALIDDESTVKEFHRGEGVIILKPRSKNKAHQPIILKDDFQIQGVVVAVIPK